MKLKKVGEKLGDLADAVVEVVKEKELRPVSVHRAIPLHTVPHPDTRTVVPDRTGYTFPDPDGEGDVRIELGTPRSQRMQDECYYCGTFYNGQFCPGCNAPRGDHR